MNWKLKHKECYQRRGSILLSIIWIESLKTVVYSVITVRKWSCGKVMFSQACVKNSVQGVSRPRPRGVCPGGCPGPGLGGCPGQDVYGGVQAQAPGGGVYPSMQWSRHPPPIRRLLLQTVRILLECILVKLCCLTLTLSSVYVVSVQYDGCLLLWIHHLLMNIINAT